MSNSDFSYMARVQLCYLCVNVSKNKGANFNDLSLDYYFNFDSPDKKPKFI